MTGQKRSDRLLLSATPMASTGQRRLPLLWALLCMLMTACQGAGGGFSGGNKASKSKKPAKSEGPAPSPSATHDTDKAPTATAQSADSAVATAENGTISSETLQKNFETIQSPGFFEAFANLSTEEYLISRIAAASNDTYEVDGFQFSGVKDLLSRYEAEALELAAKHPTMGEYYASLGIYSAADLRLENAASNLARLEAMVQNGEILDQESAEDGEGIESESGEHDSNSDFALERPWCEKDHIWDIPIYKEHCHPDGGYLGNQTCTPAVYREHGHRCNETPQGQPGPFPGGGFAG